MSIISDVGAIIDGIKHNAWSENARNMHYWTNKSGGSLTSGDVVILDTANSKAFKTTTSEADVKVVGVIPQIDTDDGTHVGTLADQTIANNALGWVQHSGDIAKVNVTATTVIGDFLVASTTVKKAKPVAAWQSGVFAIATSACTGAGTVSAKLFKTQQGVVAHSDLTGIGTKTHTELDAHLAASAAVHGLPASVNVLGNRSAAGEFIQRGTGTKTVTASGAISLLSGGYQDFTFPVAFGTAPIVVATGMVLGTMEVVGIGSISATTLRLYYGSDYGSSYAHLFYYIAVGS